MSPGPRLRLAALLIAATLLPERPGVAATEHPPATPAEVWAGYDPRQEPLEVEVKRRWSERGADWTEFYFTGMTYEGSKVRIYAMYAAPSGGKHLPAVLHVHGGGQTVSPEWLRFWTGRGYAALTFNWGGEWPGRTEYARWGKLRQGNHRECGAMAEATQPTVRVSSWYLWTRVSRRALTALERQPEVDPERLGVFGVSMGGSIVWPLAAMDRRVKAACAIYGAGWTTYPDELGAPDPRAADPATRLWRAAMEPESYAPLVRCPILFLSATNDHHGKMDWAYRTLDRTPAEKRQALTPRCRHHVAAAEGEDLPLWMDAWLKGGARPPASPVARVDLDGAGVPRLTLRPDAPGSVERAELFYAVENRNPKNRFWRSAAGRRRGETWEALLPVLDTHQPLFAFANVHYRSGFCLSSNVVTVVPADIGPARATDAPSLRIDDFAGGTGDWVTHSTATDPVPPVPELLRGVTGPDGVPGITVTQAIPLTTHKVGDPKWRGPAGAALSFRVYVPAARKLRVVLHENEFALGWKQYAATVRLEPAPGWQTVTLHAKDFVTDKGEALGGWDVVRQLELATDGEPGKEPTFTGFRWVK